MTADLVGVIIALERVQNDLRAIDASRDRYDDDGDFVAIAGHTTALQARVDAWRPRARPLPTGRAGEDRRPLPRAPSEPATRADADSQLLGGRRVTAQLGQAGGTRIALSRADPADPTADEAARRAALEPSGEERRQSTREPSEPTDDRRAGTDRRRGRGDRRRLPDAAA